MTISFLFLTLSVSLPLVLLLLAVGGLWLLLKHSKRIGRALAAGNPTSPIAPAIAVEGTLLQVGNAQSPETFYTVANVTDIQLPLKADMVDVTNVSNLWRARIPTLLDMGSITFKIFWVMEETSHRNSANTGTIAAGLRYLFVNKLGRNWNLIYPDGNNSTDAFFAYVTKFDITGKVGGVFEASIELSNSGAPSLV